ILDIVVIVATLGCLTLIGLPVTLLFPADTFRLRTLAAPQIGLGLLAAVALNLYILGISPRTSLMLEAAAGSLIYAVSALAGRTRWRLSGVTGAGSLRLAAGVILVALLALSPAWIGGQRYTIFQGNVYDQFHSFLAGSVGFTHYD